MEISFFVNHTKNNTGSSFFIRNLIQNRIGGSHGSLISTNLKFNFVLVWNSLAVNLFPG